MSPTEKCRDLPFRKVLVANRGEIAVRICRALRELGIPSVAVHSDVDEGSVHVRAADEAVCIGGARVADSYLRSDHLVDVARDVGADAIHPGYGLLSESAEFAEACEEAGINFIGPSAAAIRQMGSKVGARQLMAAAGVPVVPGSMRAVESLPSAMAEADRIGYPVAVKASGAGGGKGFRVANDPSDLEAALRGAAGDGLRFFGDATVYLERYLEDPRHVEVQIVADSQGSVVHLFERDCSVQRRHQKLVEECPAPALSPAMRARIGDIAVAAAAAVNYSSVGTVEGLLQGDDFYFLEMNTRVQVEHAVTEMVTGIDIVREQIRIAAGHPLSFDQEAVILQGHAIECRINAEDASRMFLPQPGRVTAYREPAGVGIRVDSGIDAGSEVLPFYDPLLAKLVVWGEDRERATCAMLSALDGFEIEGVTTLLPFHKALLRSRQWADGETCRDLVESREWLAGIATGPPSAPSVAGPALDTLAAIVMSDDS